MATWRQRVNRRVFSLRPLAVARYAILKELGDEVVTVPGTDIRLALSRAVSSERLYRDGGLEPWVADAIRKYLPVGGVFFDVGAYIGFYSALARRVAGPGGLVVAFEPLVEVAVRLQRNLELNPGADALVELVACSDRVGIGEIGIDADPAASSPDAASSLSRATSRGTGRRSIPVTTIDAVATALGRFPDVVKIDVEGHEFEALAGAEQTIVASPGVRVIVELNGDTQVARLASLAEVWGCEMVHLGSAGHGSHFLLERKRAPSGGG